METCQIFNQISILRKFYPFMILSAAYSFFLSWLWLIVSVSKMLKSLTNFYSWELLIKILNPPQLGTQDRKKTHSLITSIFQHVHNIVPQEALMRFWLKGNAESRLIELGEFLSQAFSKLQTFHSSFVISLGFQCNKNSNFQPKCCQS